jgi:hypothetical protein
VKKNVSLSHVFIIAKYSCAGMTFRMSGGIIIGNGEKDRDRDKEYRGIGNGILVWDQLWEQEFIIC